MLLPVQQVTNRRAQPEAQQETRLPRSLLTAGSHELATKAGPGVYRDAAGALRLVGACGPHDADVRQGQAASQPCRQHEKDPSPDAPAGCCTRRSLSRCARPCSQVKSVAHRMLGLLAAH